MTIRSGFYCEGQSPGRKMMEFRKNQVLYLKRRDGSGTKKIKVYFMKPDGIGRAKIQNLQTGEMFLVESKDLEPCDEPSDNYRLGLV